METDFSWLFWALPAAFGLGWLASRLDVRQMRAETRLAPKAYFKGLNHLLNEQQDEAIDAFIEAVQTDPDTVELHFALGNLFRRRGDYDHAIRVHQHLLARGDLIEHDHHRAQWALAQDYQRAGLLDRAEATLHDLEKTPFKLKAQETRLTLLERTRDWQAASQLAQTLEAELPGQYRRRLAHYVCEQGQDAYHSLGVAAALPFAVQASQIDPEHGRGWVLQLQWQLEQKQWDALLPLLKALAIHAPPFAALMAQPLMLAINQHRPDLSAEMACQLQRCYQRIASLDLALALSQSHAPCSPHDRSLGEDELLAHLVSEPSLVLSTHWLEQHQPPPLPVLNSLQAASAPLKRYRCAACGFETRQYFWQCPGCQSWDSFPPRRVEEL